MSTQSFNFKLMLLAIAVTFIAILSHPLLPDRQLSLMPDEDQSKFFLMRDVRDPTGQYVSWVEGSKPYHFRCNYPADFGPNQCSLGINLATDGEHGVDLSNYHALKFNLKYTGTTTGIRISMRQFDPRFSKVGEYNSGKFQWVYVRAKDAVGDIEIPLTDIVVADWWRDAYDLPREYTKVDFSNIIILSLDLTEMSSGALQDIQFTDVRFEGPWVSKEIWYLGIIFGWLGFGVVFIIWRLILLTKKEKQQSEKIFNLIVKNSHLEDESDKFRKLSTVDALTNAFNRFGIEQIIASLAHTTTNTAIILFDIDHFKRVNDTRGHDCGDRVLQKISEVVMQNTRSGDTLGRWGGEEFVLICQNTSVGMAIALAEKLRILVGKTAFEFEKPLVVTASFGVAAMRKDESFESAFKRADEALYKAKGCGRNCVIPAEGDSPFLNNVV